MNDWEVQCALIDIIVAPILYGDTILTIENNAENDAGNSAEAGAVGRAEEGP